MATCVECSAPLEPSYKFCIQCGTRVIPAAIRPESHTADATVNPLSILALILACLVSPLAIILGHIAAFQIRRHGGRGLVMAWIATALGYLWLAGWTVAIVIILGMLPGAAPALTP